MNIGVGKQQLVEIAKALSKRVKLLILDEPTAALNDEDSDHLLDLILHLKEQGITSIIISHKLNEIKKIADTVTVIRDGKTIETIAKADVTEERIIKDMVGRDLEHRYPDHTPNIGEEMLRVEDWTAHHPQDTDARDGRQREPQRARRRDRRHRRPHGRRSHRVRDEPVRPHATASRISGKVFKHGKEIKTRTVSEAIDNGLAYATEDRKTYGLNLIEDIKRNISMASLGKLEKCGLVHDNEEFKVANEYRKLDEHQGADRARRRPASSRAATSRRSCCRSGSTPTPTCSSSTSPPAASTSARSTRSTRSSTGSPPRARASSSSPPSCPSCSASATASTPSPRAASPASCPSTRPPPKPLLKLMTMEKPR